jgi:predicted nuclease of predicted toxin-antitoxin system
VKVILDESLPVALADHLPGHDVSSVRAEGWRGIKNGSLLGLIERASFGAFVTGDKRMEHEQQLEGRPFSVLLLSTNHLPSIIPHVGKIAEALDRAQPGSLTKVDCGTFLPRRTRKPDSKPGPIRRLPS